MFKTLDPTDVQEVADYIEAEAMLREYLSANQNFVTTVRNLLADLDQKRQAADKAVKAREIFCGPWTQHAVKTTYDADLLYDLIGEEAFMRVGGATAKIVQKSVDKKRIEAAIARKEIPDDTLKEIRKVSVSYKSPKGFSW